MYRNVLVTTDGSDVAITAFNHVAQVLDPSGQATVLQVVDDIGRIIARTTPAGFEMGSAFGPDIAERVVEAQRQSAQAHLDAAKQMLQAQGLRNIETVVEQGLPGDVIVEEAHKRGCDLVVMATHGRSGIRRAVLGSVADHVLRNLEGIPVLLVHPEE